jgi:hypothetical protein
LFQVGVTRINDFKLDLVAQLFNPDPLIKEIAAWALFQLSPELYHQHAKRLGDTVRRDLDDVILYSKKIIRFEKVRFFRAINVFKSVPGIILSYLADISDEVRMKPMELLELDEKLNNNFYVLVEGSVDFYQQEKKVRSFSKGEFIGETLLLPSLNNNNLIAQSASVILKFNKDQFYELLSDNVRLADKIIELI